MRLTWIPTAIAAISLTISMPARSEDLASIRQALEGKYPLTTTTADRTDIVKPGCVVVLKKSNVFTMDVTKFNPFPNTYKNGRVTFSILAKAMKDGTRTFVSGEKLWVTKIEVGEKDVVLTLFSDAINDVRYGGAVKFPIEKGTSPSVADSLAMVAQVFDIQPSDDGTATETPSVAPPPPLPIPPPPPPTEKEQQ